MNETATALSRSNRFAASSLQFEFVVRVFLSKGNPKFSLNFQKKIMYICLLGELWGKEVAKALRLELLIFDLDGTLVDSMEDIVRSANFTLRRLGLRELPRDTIRSFVGDGIRNLVKRCMAHQTEVRADLLEGAMDIYFRFYDAHCTDHTHVYPGVRETLEQLRGKKKVVLSNKGEYYTRKILHRLQLAEAFDMILGGDSLTEKKPHPRPVRYILNALNVDPQRALIIGDSPQDIQSGKGAGIYTCAVLYGYRPESRLKGADFKIRSMPELLRIVSQ